MTYKWNGEQLGEVMALPRAAANKLRLMKEIHLKVLLWFAGNSRDFDLAICAAAIQKEIAETADALNTLVELGLLTASDTAASAPVQKADIPAEKTPEAQTPLPVTHTPIHLPQPLAAAEKPARPQFPEVLTRQKSCPDFDYLLKTAEQRLGRPITHGEMETFLYIYDTIGLPAEVILMILVDAVQKDKVKAKSSFRTYLERVAVTWSENGINTIAAAEQELCRQERQTRVKEWVRTNFTPDRTPTLLQVEMAERWLHEWQFSEDVIRVAADRCREKTGGFNSAYITRILESWHADGVQTAEAAREALMPKRRGDARPLLSDESAGNGTPDEYEKAAASYRPVYQKKE